MSQPFRIPRQHVRPPVEAPTAQPGPDPLTAFQLRGELTRAELALLELVRRMMHGRKKACVMGNQRLADELGVNPRTVRKLKASLVDKGLLAIVYRKGPGGRDWTSVMAVSEPRFVVAVDKLAQAGGGGGPEGPGGEALEGRPRGGPEGPPKVFQYPKRGEPEPAPGSAEYPGPLFSPTYVNPLLPRHRPGSPAPLNDAPADRLFAAYRAGEFLFTEYEGYVRTVVAIRAKERGAYLFLLDESSPDAEPQRVAVPNLELGRWKFWR